MSDRPIAGDEPLARLRPAAYNLGDLLPEYALLNHGCLFTHGGLDEADDPVVDHLTHLGVAPGEVLMLTLDWAPFVGIDRVAGRARWDRRLVAIPRRLWDDLLRELSGIVLSDPSDGSLWRALPRAIYLQEPGVATGRLDPGSTGWAPATLLGLVGPTRQVHAVNPAPSFGDGPAHGGRIVVRDMPGGGPWAPQPLST